MNSFLTLLLLFLGVAHGRDVPLNVRNLYNNIVDQGSCKDVLATGFYSTDDNPGDFSYCGDQLATSHLIYISGPSGQLTNMDVDCDGTSGGPAENGQCSTQSSPDYQNTTAFQATIASYRTGILDLSPYIHPYVVLGNTGPSGDYTPNASWPTFDPSSQNVQPLSVVIVVCNNQLVYGVWGDTNGADGAHALVGETSYALATACFPDEGLNGDNGHDGNDVLYLAFGGQDAVPGRDGARWNATSYEEFEESLAAIGDRLVARIPEGGAGRVQEGGWLGVRVMLVVGVVSVWVVM